MSKKPQTRKPHPREMEGKKYKGSCVNCRVGGDGGGSCGGIDLLMLLHLFWGPGRGEA